MRFLAINDEVLAASGPLIEVTRTDIELIKQRAAANQRQRVRICAHLDTQDRLHEMLIVHMRGAYVRPHKHLNKSESFHLIEGQVDVVFFDEAGAITEVFHLGEYNSGGPFYYRLAEARYHTLLIHSEFLVFHETTNGPFRREETVFPSWAPEESDPVACRAFQERIAESIRLRS